MAYDFYEVYAMEGRGFKRFKAIANARAYAVTVLKNGKVPNIEVRAGLFHEPIGNVSMFSIRRNTFYWSDYRTDKAYELKANGTLGRRVR